MADDIAVLDGAGNARTLRAKDNAGVHVPYSVPASSGGVALFQPSAALTDGLANPTVPLIGVGGLLYNPAAGTWDRERGNHDFTVLASGARAGTTYSAELSNINCRGLLLMATVSVAVTGETLRLIVQAKNPITGAYNEIAYYPANDFSTYNARNYILYPGITKVTTQPWLDIEAVPLPRAYRVGVIHSAAGSWTYSIGGTHLT